MINTLWQDKQKTECFNSYVKIFFDWRNASSKRHEFDQKSFNRTSVPCINTSYPGPLCQPLKAGTWLSLPMSTVSCLLVSLSGLPISPLVISLLYKMLVIVPEPQTGLKAVFTFLLMCLHIVELNIRFYFILTI